MNLKNYEMVRNEIEALKLCQHPNIVPLIHVLENSENVFLVMEYLGGGTLRDYVKRNGNRLKEEEAQRIVYSIASALEYMKKYAILHRDLKPINILLTSDPSNQTVKLADFGLATILLPSEQCKNYAGTLDFCSPEVILGIPYSYSADIWSLGVITYYLVYGALPFGNMAEEDLKRYC